MAQKTSAPAIERMQPESLMRSLLILMSCSARVLSNGTCRSSAAGGVAGADARPDREAFRFFELLRRAAFRTIRHRRPRGTTGSVPGSPGRWCSVLLRGGVGGFLQFQQGVDGLLRPDHVVSVPVSVTAMSSRSRERCTERARRRRCSCRRVSRRRGGDAGEGGQHPGGVHALFAAPWMHGNEHELPRRCRVDPGELPGDRDPVSSEAPRRPGQGRGDGGDRRGDEPGDLRACAASAPGDGAQHDISPSAARPGPSTGTRPCHR